MATARVGGLRADITARDTGFQAAVNRTVRSFSTLQTTANRVQRSFATQNSAARSVVRTYQQLATTQNIAATSTQAFSASLSNMSNALKSASANLLVYIRNINLTSAATTALNLATGALTGSFIAASTAALSAFGPQGALIAAGVGTAVALFGLFNNRLAETNRQLTRMERITARVNAIFNRLVNAAVFVGLTAAVGQLVRGFTNSIDAITNLTNRIRLVSDAGTNAADTLERLRQVAEGTRTSLASTGELYTRLAEALQGSLPTEELLAITETIQRTVVLSGVSAQSAEAALTQLAQGLAAGALRGEELNSVLEQLPRATRVLTDELGVGIGELREMAEQGQITTEVIARAFTNQAEAVQQEFATQATTVDQALTVAADKFDELLNSMNNSVGITNAILLGIRTVSTIFEGWILIFDAISRGVSAVQDFIRNLQTFGLEALTRFDFGEGETSVRDLRNEYDELSESVAELTEAEKSFENAYRAASAEVRKQRDLVRDLQGRNVGRFFGFGQSELEEAEEGLENAREQARNYQTALGNISTELDEKNERLTEVTATLQTYVQATEGAIEAAKDLAEENPKLSMTIAQLDDALTVEQWGPYSDAIEDAGDAVEDFSRKYQAMLQHNERVRMNIDQLDVAIDDETHLRRIQALLDNNAQIAEFFKEEVVETVDEYARWIAEQQRLNAEFQKAIDLEVAGVGEDIAGRIFFGINQQIEPVIQHIDQLDDALTNNQWETYADAVREAQAAVAAFRGGEGSNLNFLRSDRENLEIDQLDALLGDEQHLQYIQELLRQSGQIAEHFKVEVEEIVDEYANWIAEQQRLNEEFQRLADDELSDVGERIAGSINFAEQAVVRITGSLEDLDAALSDEEWIQYREAVDEARIAINQFYEDRQRVIANPEDLTIDQLNARLDDETHLEHIQQILEDNADIARFFTEETKATVSEYDRWIERMRELHQAAQDTRDLAVARTAEELAGAITFNAASRLTADQQTIEELDAALTDEQWIQYREAVDAAAESIDEFREKNKSAFELLTEDVREFAMALGDNIAQSLGDAITGVTSFGDAFRNVASFIIRRLIQMTLEATLFQNALTSGGASGGGLGGIFRNILDFFSRGPSSGNPHRQLGGPVSAGQRYFVGESGLEEFVPNTSGRIIPNDQLVGGGVGDLTINVNGVQDPTIVRAAIYDEVPTLVEIIKGNYASDMTRPSVARTATRAGVR